MVNFEQHYVRHFGGQTGMLSKVVELSQAGYTIDYKLSRAVTRDLYLIVTDKIEGENVESQTDKVITEVPEKEVAGLDVSDDDFDFDELDDLTEKELTVEEELNSLSKKADLIEFAEKHKLELTAEMVMPAQIKKHLKGVLGFE